MTKKKYLVLREHEGDRVYKEGETRTAEDGDVAHLIPRVLEPIAGKGEKAPRNKAERAPANKAS